MANNECINGTWSGAGADHSSAVPVIGLYAAMASFTLFLVMLYDIIDGFRANKRWLPCKWFTLNSVTLMLLSVAAKLPVDLTSDMPSDVDQLSKLTGSTLVCTAMGFILPSLGNNSQFECWTNMVALTIFVITIVVNLCIQISTQVIVLFVVEHIMIMCFMLLTVGILWYFALDNNCRKDSDWNTSTPKQCNLRESKRGLRGRDWDFGTRLEICYKSSFRSNPQLEASSDPNIVAMGGICLCSLIVVVQALIRSPVAGKSEFFSADSSYKWSMWPIVITQILTILLGCLATNFRYLSMLRYANISVMTDFWKDLERFVIDRNPLLRSVSYWGKCRKCLVCACLVMLLLVQLFFQSLFILPQLVCSCLMPKSVVSINGKRWTWKRKKSEEDMRRWRKLCKPETLINLEKLLPSGTPNLPLPRIVDDDKLREYSLSVVLLVRLAQVLLPEESHGVLVQTFMETRDIIHFIAERAVHDGKDNEHLPFVKWVWSGPGFSCFLPKIQQGQSKIQRANLILDELLKPDSMPPDRVNSTLAAIVPLIRGGGQIGGGGQITSIDILSTTINKMFVERLHALLAQFPKVVFESLSESSPEEFEGRLKLAVKFYWKLEPSAQKIQWVFPPGWANPKFEKPIPVPVPPPVPAPAPVLVPVPAPVPVPALVPVPAPVQALVPVPVPAATPTPVLVPAPVSVPVSTPTTVPTLAPPRSRP